MILITIHYLSLIGVCVDPNPNVPHRPVYIITEHMPGGILLHYLQSKGNSGKKSQLCRMCIDVAKVCTNLSIGLVFIICSH